ncbi:unnamed protein product [Amoebophrya sp. A120]|nr:unnamed protein product [Amoebophrya sp. A120]|eukprot:GSA120T00000271001.1
MPLLPVVPGISPHLLVPKASGFAVVVHSHWTQVYENYHWLPEYLQQQEQAEQRGQQRQQQQQGGVGADTTNSTTTPTTTAVVRNRLSVNESAPFANLLNGGLSSTTSTLGGGFSASQFDPTVLDLLGSRPVFSEHVLSNELFDYTYRNHIFRLHDRNSNVVVFFPHMSLMEQQQQQGTNATSSSVEQQETTRTAGSLSAAQDDEETAAGRAVSASSELQERASSFGFSSERSGEVPALDAATERSSSHGTSSDNGATYEDEEQDEDRDLKTISCSATKKGMNMKKTARITSTSAPAPQNQLQASTSLSLKIATPTSTSHDQELTIPELFDEDELEGILFSRENQHDFYEQKSIYYEGDCSIDGCNLYDFSGASTSYPSSTTSEEDDSSSSSGDDERATGKDKRTNSSPLYGNISSCCCSTSSGLRTTSSSEGGVQTTTTTTTSTASAATGGGTTTDSTSCTRTSGVLAQASTTTAASSSSSSGRTTATRYNYNNQRHQIDLSAEHWTMRNGQLERPDAWTITSGPGLSRGGTAARMLDLSVAGTALYGRAGAAAHQQHTDQTCRPLIICGMSRV